MLLKRDNKRQNYIKIVIFDKLYIVLYYEHTGSSENYEHTGKNKIDSKSVDDDARTNRARAGRHFCVIKPLG